jgi:arylsulfatase A-like enzyme
MTRGDGFPAGITANQFMANIDLAPTIAQLAGGVPRLVMGGRSLLPMAQDPSFATARDLLIEGRAYKAVCDNLVFTCRTRQW